MKHFVVGVLATMFAWYCNKLWRKQWREAKHRRWERKYKCIYPSLAVSTGEAWRKIDQKSREPLETYWNGERWVLRVMETK